MSVGGILGGHISKIKWFIREFDIISNLCLNENLCSKITLQPLERFELDAAIIFSDILMLPYGLNQKVEFQKNLGPKLGFLDLKIASKF